MNWKKLIQEILCAGLTQRQIASDACTSQSNISKILNVDGVCPKYELGSLLIALHKKVVKDLPAPKEMSE